MTTSQIIYHTTGIAARTEKLHNLASDTRKQLDDFRMTVFQDFITQEEKDLLYKASLILDKVCGNTTEHDARRIAEKYIAELQSQES